MRRCNDDITAAIAGLTTRVWLYRLVRRETSMPLELKGLKAKAMAARAHIGKLDAAYEAFNAKAGSHASDVEGLTAQIGYMSDDLSFATATLGNSVAASNGDTEAVDPPPVTFDHLALDPERLIQQPPAAPAAVILNGSPGMQGTHDVQLIRS